MFTKSALILVVLVSLAIANAHAGQMGWTLQQCRERFGSEFTPTDTDSYSLSEHMPYWHSSQDLRVADRTHQMLDGNVDIPFPENVGDPFLDATHTETNSRSSKPASEDRKVLDLLATLR